MDIRALRDIQDALSRAESFMSEFEDDPDQEDMEDDLEAVRIALGLVASAIRFAELKENPNAQV